MEALTERITAQEEEVKYLEEELEHLLGAKEVCRDKTEIDEPEALKEAKVENEKLRYRLNILKRAVEKELSASV